jgi:AcrR family transcriptional regulator
VAAAESRERTNQKARTERAIVEACVGLIRQRRSVTMPDVARAAMVSEATAYRYFPDLTSLLAKALAADWPTPAEALAPVAASKDPVERVAFATRFLLRGVAERQAVVRSMISAAMVQPELTGKARPGIRFGLIEYALALFVDDLNAVDPELLTQLRLDLALVVSAEALFTLTDLCGLSIDEAIESAERTATTLTIAAFNRIGGSPLSSPAASGH